MLPNFALSLSFEGIRLLHRVSGGWMLVGETTLDLNDLSGALRILHDTARRCDPDALVTKLVIPEAQIKYLSLRTGDVDDAARWVAARAALDGATPYPVSELVFDMAADGPVTHVAAVARETLTEAEAFAVAHQFNPVSFVATPQTEAQFPGEPFFGPTAAAKAQMGPVPPVVRDSDPIRIVDAPVEIDAAVEDGIGEDSIAAPASDPASDPTSDPASDPDAKPDAVADPIALAVGTPPDTEDPSDMGTAITAPQPQEISASDETLPEAVPDALPKAAPDTLTDALPEAVPDALPDALPEEVSEPTRDVTVSEADSPDSSPGSPDQQPAQQADQWAEQGAAKDPADPETCADGGADDLRTEHKPPASPPASPPADPPRPAAPITGFASRRAAASQPRLGGVTRDPTPARPSVMAPSLPLDPNDPPTAPRRLPEPPPAAAASLQAVGPKDDARLDFVAPRRQTQAMTGAATMGDPSTSFEEAQRLTIFGARRPAGEVGGKPRFLGLMLTVVLLVCLAGVAAWAAVFMENGIAGLFRDRAPAEAEITANQPDAPLPDVPAPALPATGPGVSTLGNREDPPPVRADRSSALDPPAAQARPAFAPEAATERRAALEALAPVATATATEPEEQSAPNRAAATQIWDVSPERPSVPALSPFGDLTARASTLTGYGRPDSRTSALPRIAALNADRALQDVPSPAPAGTRFELDARGLVIPTEAGAVNPDGVRVFAGQPPAVPPERPASDPSTEADTAADTVADTGADTGAEAIQPDDPERRALAAVRPQLRPERAEPAEPADAPVTEVAPPAPNPQLAAIRPQLRPRSIAAAPEPATAEPQIIAVPESIFEDLLDEETGAPPTQQAVATSLRPDTRPRDFDRVVARATPRDAAPRPRTIRPRTVAPPVPSSTSVTRQATIDNAINLGRINLIGVFGTPADRLALVRLPNGRHQKVKVGDRLDGGQVLAISDSELRYQKRGRNLSLTIPGG